MLLGYCAPVRCKGLSRSYAPAAGLLCSSRYTDTLILGERSIIEAFSCTSCTALSGTWQEAPCRGKAEVSDHMSLCDVRTARPT